MHHPAARPGCCSTGPCSTSLHVPPDTGSCRRRSPLSKEHRSASPAALESHRASSAPASARPLRPVRCAVTFGTVRIGGPGLCPAASTGIHRLTTIGDAQSCRLRGVAWAAGFRSRRAASRRCAPRGCPGCSRAVRQDYLSADDYNRLCSLLQAPVSAAREAALSTIAGELVLVLEADPGIAARLETMQNRRI